MDKPEYYAFFDVDNTIINIKSMFSFLRFFFRNQSAISFFGDIKYYWFLLKVKIFYFMGKDRFFINKYYYKNFCGQYENNLTEIGMKWYDQTLKNNPLNWNSDVLNQIKQHQNKGAEIVLVSGSMLPCLLPIANRFEIKYLLATELESKNGRLTGEVHGSVVIGNGKADKINAFLDQKNFNDFDKCYVYGDHKSDIPMLNLLGCPVIVRGDKDLEEYARQHSWEII